MGGLYEAATDCSDKMTAMTFGLVGTIKRSADLFGPEWLAWRTAFCNKPNAIFNVWLSQDSRRQ